MRRDDQASDALEGSHAASITLKRMLGYLDRHPLFRAVDQAGRESLATVITERLAPAHEVVLLQGGPPSDELLVILEGTVELLHGEHVVDVMGNDELFGELSLLTGCSPELTVRTLEDTTFVVVPRDAALELLGSPCGLAYVADVFRQRLARAVGIRREPSPRHMAMVSSLVNGAAPTCLPDTPISEVAKLMSDSSATAALVQGRDSLGIVTNNDLRDKVLLAGGSVDAPVERIMTTPARSVSENALAADAALEMVRSGVSHLAVLDATGRPVGIVSADSFMTLGALSPLALHHALSAASDHDEVVTVAARLPEVFLGLVDSGLEPAAVSRVVTAEQDAIVVRLIELTAKEQGPAPARFAWLALGSAGRTELTLASDQDNALAYADSDDPGVATYFAALAARVTDGLRACGFEADRSGVTADRPEWRLCESAWRRLFGECLVRPDELHVMGASIVFDFRRVMGDLAVVPSLLDIMRDAPRHPGFMTGLAATVVDVPSPLGFRRRLSGPVNLKKSGLLPLENLARFWTIGAGVTTPSTLDRLATIEAAGNLSGDTVASLRAALSTISRLRLRHHADLLATGRPLSNVIDSAELSRPAHAELQEALQVVDDARKAMSAPGHGWR